MRVICDQCAATYNVPNAKLTRPITTASCKSCGAQLRIPKPRPGMPDDEQVVVQAIPASGGLSKGDIVRPGFEEDDDKTMPVVDARARGVEVDDDVPLLAGTPLSASEKATLQSTGKLGGASPAAPPPVVRRAGAGAAVPATNASDVGGGLVVAFVGVVFAAVGVVLLGIVDTAVVRVPGLFLGLAGTLTAMFVLAFGSFGRANGRGALSAALGVLFSLLMVPAIALLHGDFALPRISFASAPAAPVPVAPAPSDDDAALASASDDDDDDDAVAATDDAKTKTRTSAKKPTATPKSSSAAGSRTAASSPRETPSETTSSGFGGRTEPTEAPRPAPTREPSRTEPVMAARDDYDPPPSSVRSAPPPPPPAPDPGPSVPAPVLDMIIKNNVGVKKCFYESMKADEVSRGAVVRTTFQLSASGSASNLRVNNPELRGGRLERCLDGAFAGMSFPSSASGGPINYAFNL